MTERPNGEVWTAEELLGRLERGDTFFVLDVRNRDEFERFRLEGRSPVPAVNIPYFEMLELGGKDEMLDSVVAYVEGDLADHGCYVSGIEQEPPCLEDKLLRHGREDAAVHDEGEERQLARGDDRPRAGTGRANDRLRVVSGPAGNQGVGTRRRPGERRTRQRSSRFDQATPQPFLGRAASGLAGRRRHFLGLVLLPVTERG